VTRIFRHARADTLPPWTSRQGRLTTTKTSQGRAVLEGRAGQAVRRGPSRAVEHHALRARLTLGPTSPRPEYSAEPLKAPCIEGASGITGVRGARDAPTRAVQAAALSSTISEPRENARPRVSATSHDMGHLD
jgi:hypothetical protein